MFLSAVPRVGYCGNSESREKQRRDVRSH